MIVGLHHIGITVPDLSKAIDYQRAVLGRVSIVNYAITDTKQHRKVMGINNSDAKAALIRCPNAFIELMEFSSPQQSDQTPRLINEHGYTHYCVQGKLMSPLEQRYRDAGSDFFSAPLDLGTGNSYCYLGDQQHSIIELEALPWAPDDTDFWLAHVALVTADIKQLAEFYGQVFASGSQPITTFRKNRALDKMARHSNVALQGCWLPSSNMLLEIWQYDQPEVIQRQTADSISRPGISHFALEVTDIESEITRLSGLGMSFLSEALVGDGTNLVYGHDPDGNIVELIEMTNPASKLSLRHSQYPNRIADLAAAKRKAAS